VTAPTWRLERDQMLNAAGASRQERIAAAVEAAINAGRLRPGDRLPPVRRLAEELRVSGATVAAAYDLLGRRGRARGEVGRGTFVLGPSPVGANAGEIDGRRGAAFARPGTIPAAPWRRRTLAVSASRLRAAYPAAVDCSSGKPDASLLALTVLRRAWHAAIEQTGHADLQYAGPDPVEQLARQLLPRLEADGVPARPGDLVIGSSAQQFMVLGAAIAASAAPGQLAVAVEEPGYQTAFDTFERAGYRLSGVEVDDDGAIPGSLGAALAAGARAVLFTPRVHNPTGASWSPRRLGELADILAAHPGVIAIEDDQFAGVAGGRPGSLLADPRIDDRVLYVRSFAKAVAPDLRLAVAVARPRLRALLNEAKSFADGWSSRLAQRALGHALADGELDVQLAAARDAYAARRAAALTPLVNTLAPLGGGATGADGVNLWVHLPPGADAAEAVERAATLGVLVAPGEPFYVRPGQGGTVRLSIGGVDAVQAAEAGWTVATAASAARAHSAMLLV
jgi:GntR family transcriptional regulator/MocR family aminotransferase